MRKCSCIRAYTSADNLDMNIRGYTAAHNLGRNIRAFLPACIAAEFSKQKSPY
jgi:hypothetical protein